MMMKSKYIKYFNTLLISVSFVFVFFLGVFLNEKYTIKIPFIESAVVKASTGNVNEYDMGLFFDVLEILKTKSIYYPDTVSNDQMYGAIQGMVASLGDPYTEFLGPKQTKQFNESINGSFDGIGAEIGKKDGFLIIVTPLKNSPSEKAGLLSGDKIISINKESAQDISIEDAVNKIRGKKGTPVELEIYRENEQSTRFIEINRDTIVIPTLEYKMVDGVFVISIYNFGEKVVSDFVKALNEFNASGSKYLILDLRGNPGGYLESAVDIASYFIPKGKTIVTEDYTKLDIKKVHTSYGYNSGIRSGTKLLVLVNGGSASASEILAGALRDNKIAKIAGEKTFGKGSVQELIPLKEDTSLKITIARWLVPNGESIDKNGLNPDFEIKYKASTEDPKFDNQLQEAIKIIKK